MTREVALQLALGYGSLFEEKGIPARRCDGMPPPTESAELAHAHALIRDAVHSYREIVSNPSCNLREAVSIAQFACFCAGLFTWDEIEEQWRTGVIEQHVPA